ncbi:FkbM family methyltransferase [Nitrospiraceae bacterium AH_259_D15_M11_P09]|nr:FkbM family methyltransferase [Nitrospiraceae bacterium AH_259_D15_M11_P09]
MVIKVGISSELEHFRAETYSTKEPETIEWLNWNLKDHDVFFDVGANIGLYSLYAAKFNPQCTVYAFEPESQNFARLCTNISINGLTNIIPCNFPLARRETFDFFYVGDMQPGSALHSFGRMNELRLGAENVPLRQGCLAVTLDALAGKYGLPQPALLKIDVDGIENEILDGGEVVLRSNKLRTVLVELNLPHGGHPMGQEQRFASLGYKLQRMGSLYEMSGIRSQNYIFQRIEAVDHS